MNKEFAIIEIGSNNTKTHIYENDKVIYEKTTTDVEWSVNIGIGDVNFHYDFDTKSIEYNSLSHIRR